MQILRFLLHFISLLALIAAIVAGTLDAIQSVSSSDVVITSLGNTWLTLDPEGLALAEMSADDYIGRQIWGPYVAPMLAQPTFAILLMLALVFWIAGYSRPSPKGRFSA